MESEWYKSRALTPLKSFPSGVEGPACDTEGNLYAVNYLERHTVGKVTPSGECSLALRLSGGSTGCGMRFNQNGSLMIADHTNHNILKADVRSGEVKVFAHEPAMNQPNDLAITKTDILFASDPNWKQGSGNLWRIGSDGLVTLLEAGMGTTNGIEVSPDEKTLYVNETLQLNIWAYDLTREFDISNKRLLIHFDDYGLDGMRCDMNGNLYVTRYGKGTVAVIDPAGNLVKEIPLLGRQCTNLTFGGSDGCTCYITVADNGNIESFRTEIPGRCWGLRQPT